MMMEDAPCRKVTFGIEAAADYTATDIKSTAKGISYTLNAGSESARIELGIPGRFTVYNSLGCAAACLAYGLTLREVALGLAQVKTVPGRIEVVPTGDRPFTVVLDYAHTPDGLVNILSAVRGFAKGRIIAVFGCGGDRDPDKRPKMGYAAGKGSDYCIVTSDNPRTEDPKAIIDAIIPGVMKSGCAYEVVVNRIDAIVRALNCAQKDDVIVLAGKGHEPYQEIHGVRYPFDEKEIVAKALSGIAQ
jgi:UDP-N-acetylmuramoyl-L-alanyl-D-glutamate--2,6-diaminopimelate ligase